VDFQFMIRTMLKMGGYEVRSLLEGKPNAAVDIAKQCDIVLLDVDLPGANGVDVGKQLKSSPETSNIPVILVTANTECDKVFILAQANDFIQKPFSLAALMGKIKELLKLKID
jgi:DNA-binding response OmpR family regulator